MNLRLAGCSVLLVLAVSCGSGAPPEPPPPPPPPATPEIDLSRCTLTVSPGTTVVADGTELATATVTVKDTTGAAVASVPVQLLSTGTGNLLSPVTSTDSTGTARLTLRSTVSELKT